MNDSTGNAPGLLSRGFGVITISVARSTRKVERTGTTVSLRAAYTAGSLRSFFRSTLLQKDPRMARQHKSSRRDSRSRSQQQQKQQRQPQPIDQAELSARDRVVASLIEKAITFPDLNIEPLSVEGLDGRDAALAVAIEQAALRRWLSLVAVLEHCLDRPWDNVQPELQGPFLTGAAQILLFDRIPEHAAVNHAVDWVKVNGPRKASGFVNAVLRSIARLPKKVVETSDRSDQHNAHDLPLGDGRTLRFENAIFAQDHLAQLAQQTSHPESLIARWIGRFGEQATIELCHHNLIQPPTILTGPGIARLQSLDMTPHNNTSCAVFEGDHFALQTLLDQHPDIWVQDSASRKPAELTRHLEPKLIVDVCAGLGTKTHQLALMHPNAKIVATDVHPGRREVLHDRFRDNEQVEIVTIGQLDMLNGQVDLIVLDVPCSNTGVLARRVEAKYRASKATILELVDVQRQIIADAIPMRNDGGAILYATCSIEPDENEKQAEWISKWHKLKVSREEFTMPVGQPGDDAATYHDGGYACLMVD